MQDLIFGLIGIGYVGFNIYWALETYEKKDNVWTAVYLAVAVLFIIILVRR